MTRSGRSSLIAAVFLLGACGQSTELMLVIKAASTLTYGLPGSDSEIDTVYVDARPTDNPPLQFTFTKSITLCAQGDAPDAGCQPVRYVDDHYGGDLTLPVNLLLIPGGLGADKTVSVDVLAQKDGGTRIGTHLEFGFVLGRRLWLEVPLYAECLDKRACETTNQACTGDCAPDATGFRPTYCCETPMPTLTAPSLQPDDLSVPLADMETPPRDFALPPIKCGNNQDPCCLTGASCLGDMLACTGDRGFCVPAGSTCGNLGQGCCDAGQACTGGGLACNSAGSCECGGEGQSCCTTGDNQCTSGTSGSLTCFAADQTQAPLGSPGICHACGHLNEPCCPRPAPGSPGTCILGTTACDPASFQCVNCGGSAGAPCCGTGSSATCGSPASLVCPSRVNRSGDQCIRCGADTQACCAEQPPLASSCPSAPADVCVADQCTAPCGGPGQMCCTGTGGAPCIGLGNCVNQVCCEPTGTACSRSSECCSACCSAGSCAVSATAGPRPGSNQSMDPAANICTAG